MERLTPLLVLAIALSLAVAGEALAQDAQQNPTTTVAPATTVAMPVDVDVDVPAQQDAVAPQEDAPLAVPPQDDATTQAEQDYADIYGDDAQQYADPTLPAPAQIAESYDPWEPMNRRMHKVNNVIDRRIAKPLATAYIAVVPRPVRLGVTNFFSNLNQPLSAINALLQGKPKQAGQAMGRFMLNSTLGLGGLFDPASDAKIPYRSEDFGQTLGVWGWKQSRYVELPLFGPRTVRDLFGMSGDAQFGLLRGLEDDKTRVFLQGLQLVDVRTQLMSLDGMREGAADDYTLVRDAWLQRRAYQIFGDRDAENADLPEYLQDENNPTVPIDAIPVTPMDGS